MVKNPLSNAGDAGSIPGRGTKIPHARATKPSCRNYRAHTLWSPRTLEPTPHNYREVCVPQLRPDAAKNKQTNKYIFFKK